MISPPESFEFSYMRSISSVTSAAMDEEWRVFLIVLGVAVVILVLCCCMCKYTQKRIGTKCRSLFFFPGYDLCVEFLEESLCPGSSWVLFLCLCFFLCSKRKSDSESRPQNGEEEKSKTSRAANILTGVAATGHEMKTKLAAGLQRNSDVEAQVQNGKEEGEKKKNSKTSMAVGLLTDAAVAGGSLVKEKAKRIPLPTSLLGRKE